MSDSRHVSVVCVLACDKRVRVPLSQQPSGCFVHRFVEMACSISNSSMLQQQEGFVVHERQFASRRFGPPPL